MAVISRGQITIVDLNDGKSINLYLGSNVATTQIFNKENSSYVPNWTASPFLVITRRCMLREWVPIRFQDLKVFRFGR